MPFDYRIVAAVVGIALELVSEGVYVCGTLKNTIRPHVFTWLGWGIIATIVGAAQFVSGAGATVWVTASVALMCFTVASLALRQGNAYIHPSDWIFFIGSVCAILSWLLTHEPLVAVVIVMIADTLAFVPMIRKAYKKPDEDSALAFFFSTLRNVFALIALQSFVPVNWIYPSFIFFSDGTFMTLILIRRYQRRPSV